MNKVIPILICITTLLWGGCESTPEEIIESITPNVKAQIDGQAFETNVAVGASAIAVAITATKNEEVIVLTIPSVDAGIYSIDGITTNATYTPNITDSLNALYAGFEGQIEITDVNSLGSQVQGNFHFKCVNAITLDTISVTNGQLNNIPIR